MANVVDASNLKLAELVELAHAASADATYLVLTGSNLKSAYEIAAITTLGRGYVSFRFEPADKAGKTPPPSRSP